MEDANYGAKKLTIYESLPSALKGRRA